MASSYQNDYKGNMLFSLREAEFTFFNLLENLQLIIGFPHVSNLLPIAWCPVVVIDPSWIISVYFVHLDLHHK